MKNPTDAKKPQDAGSRNDDSSLFSLAALKESQAAATSKTTTDDSGLIDLRALAQIERSQQKPKDDLGVASVVAPENIFGGGLGLGSPLIAPPPAAAVAAPPPEQVAAAAQNKRGMFMAIGAIGVAIVIGGVFVLTRGGPPAATTPTATAAATAAPTAPAPDPSSAEPTVAAVTPGQRATPTATATATAAAAAKPVVKGPMPVAKGPASKPAPAPGPAAPPPPPKEACDLTCQMQRAVQKK